MNRLNEADVKERVMAVLRAAGVTEGAAADPVAQAVMEIAAGALIMAVAKEYGVHPAVVFEEVVAGIARAAGGSIALHRVIREPGERPS